MTQHAALHQFTYPQGTTDQLLLLDVTTDLSRSFQGVGLATLTTTSTGTRITGSGEYLPSFGEGSYQVFFCFDGPTFQQAVFSNNGAIQEVSASGFNTSLTVAPSGFGLSFKPEADNVLRVRMGISWTSTAKACAYAEEEIPDLSAFDSVMTAARYEDSPLGIRNTTDESLLATHGTTF